MKYLKREDTLIPYCYLGLQSQFASRQAFDHWYAGFNSERTKDKLLQVGSLYSALVKNGDWCVDLPGSDDIVEYFTNSYKLVGIFSLIESLSEMAYLDFYNYLVRRKTGVSFPISREDLDHRYETYNQEHGATRKCIAFFAGLPEERQRELVSKLSVSGTTPSLENFARYLYKLRSRFVHNAELIHPISNRDWIGNSEDGVMICKLSLIDTMAFFEEGLVLWCDANGT